MKVGIIIQARMGSQRLPGKVLKKMAGKTILEILIKRIKAVGLPIIIATTKNTNDDILEEKIKSYNIQCFRGSEEDVLSRYYECALINKFDTIVRLTADNPFVDAELIKEGVSQFENQNKKDLYLTTEWYPLGVALEIFSFNSLSEAFFNAKDLKEREHVTPYIINNHRIEKIYKIYKTDKSHYRLTVDTEQDFSLALQLVNNYNAHNLSIDELINVLDKHNYLVQINAEIHQKLWNE